MKQTMEHEYMIFGSKSSIDFDVIIKVPLEFLNNKPNILLAQNVVMDKYFYNYLNSISEEGQKQKVVNSCFGYWEDGVLIACQKGSVEETNNSIIATFNHHQKYQMYNQCPLNKVLPRNLKSKQMKVMGALRMIVSTLSHSIFIEDNIPSIRRILSLIISIPEFQNLKKKDVDMFKILCLKIFDLKKSVINVCKATLNENDMQIVQAKYDELLKIRQLHSTLLKKEVPKYLENEYFNLRERSEIIVGEIVNIIMDNEDKFTKDFVSASAFSGTSAGKDFIKSLKSDVQGCMLTLKPITSFILKIKFLCFQTEYIGMFDFSQLELFTDKEDKYKKMAFQIGQSLALLNDIEVFEKETIAKVYPELHNFLFRLPISQEDWKNFNKLVEIFAKEIYDRNIVKRDFVELDF